MVKSLMLGIVVAAVTLPLGADTNATVTWTGWISDKGCARIVDGTVKPNGTDCVKKCLNEGATPVFLSEQAKAIFDMNDVALAKEHVGWYVRVSGVADDEKKTLTVQSVERISQVQNMCAIPKKDRKYK